VADIAVNAAEKIIKANLDKEKQVNLVNKYIDDLRKISNGRDYRIHIDTQILYFSFQQERKILKQVYDDSELICNTLAKSKELRAVLKNPVLNQQRRKILLKKFLKTR